MANFDSQNNSQDIKSWEFKIESLEKKLKTTEDIGEKKKLKNKLVICKKELDRDLNAALNILRVGTSTFCDHNNLNQNFDLNCCDSIESHVF